MVLIDGTKFSCAICFRGHRTSSCQHSDRPLFEVKKKGRPTTQCAQCRDRRNSGKQHSKCTCNQGGTPASVPSYSNQTGPKRAIRYRVNPLLNPCKCSSGGACTCAKTDDPKEYAIPDSESSSASSRSRTSVTSLFDENFPSLPSEPSSSSFSRYHPYRSSSSSLSREVKYEDLELSKGKSSTSTSCCSPNRVASSEAKGSTFDPEKFLESLLEVSASDTVTPSEVSLSEFGGSLASPAMSTAYVFDLLSGKPVEHPLSKKLVKLVDIEDTQNSPQGTVSSNAIFTMENDTLPAIDNSSPTQVSRNLVPQQSQGLEWNPATASHDASPLPPLTEFDGSSTNIPAETWSASNYEFPFDFTDPSLDLDVLLPPQLMPASLLEGKGCGCMCGAECRCSHLHT